MHIYYTALLALEHRLPLLLERLERLIPIIRSNNPLIHLILNLLPRPRHSLEPSTDRNRPALANLPRQPHALAQHRLARRQQHALILVALARLLRLLVRDVHQPVRDAQEVGLGCGDAAAREDKIARAGEADERGQAVGAAGAGDDAQARLGEADEGVGGEHAEVCREGELEAAAEGDGGDCRDCWNREVLEGGEGGAEVVQEFVGPARIRVLAASSGSILDEISNNWPSAGVGVHNIRVQLTPPV